MSESSVNPTIGRGLGRMIFSILPIDGSPLLMGQVVTITQPRVSDADAAAQYEKACVKRHGMPADRPLLEKISIGHQYLIRERLSYLACDGLVKIEGEGLAARIWRIDKAAAREAVPGNIEVRVVDPGTVAEAFDYAALDAETRIVVQQKTGEIRSLMRRAAQDIVDIGLKLIEVKARLKADNGRGSFLNWLQSEFEWSYPSAARFMQVASQFGSKSSQIDNFAPSALYLLAAPSTSETARQEALALAAKGGQVTHAEAKRIVSRAGQREATSFPAASHEQSSRERMPSRDPPLPAPCGTLTREGDGGASQHENEEDGTGEEDEEEVIDDASVQSSHELAAETAGRKCCDETAKHDHEAGWQESILDGEAPDHPEVVGICVAMDMATEENRDVALKRYGFGRMATAADKGRSR